MKVLKFGGSTLIDGNSIGRVAEIIKKESSSGRIGVVLSALKGITDQLIDAATAAEKGNTEYKGMLKTVQERTLAVVNELFKKDEREAVMISILNMFQELNDILRGIELVRECSLRSLDLVMSFGERMSCTLVKEYLVRQNIKAEYHDTRELVVTNDMHGNARVDIDPTYTNIRKRLLENPNLPIITGFIAATPEGVTTTLGRNGSDYTASLIAAALDAEDVEIWTDVDGVMSADPRLVDEAFVIPELSVEEAMEMSYFGAEVLHPRTMIPAVEKNIPIVIKNIDNPAGKGTLIAKKVKRHKQEITGIASIERVALVNIIGGGMVGIPGIASRVFSCLARAHINIIMISQASSEHSICIVFRKEQGEKAIASLREEFEEELKTHQIEQFELISELEIVAIIGENMRGRRGLAGKLFSAVGKAGVNILAIAQGSSERNISFVVEHKWKKEVLEVIHHAFFKA